MSAFELVLHSNIPLGSRSVDFLEPPTAANVATGPKKVATRWLGWPDIPQVPDTSLIKTE
uniref:Uncharacterized protein n=1 Tax=Romanomermis culicivorax TaxID=13658 RepID=A0A915KK09_ROMCU